MQQPKTILEVVIKVITDRQADLEDQYDDERGFTEGSQYRRGVINAKISECDKMIQLLTPILININHAIY